MNGSGANKPGCKMLRRWRYRQIAVFTYCGSLSLFFIQTFSKVLIWMLSNGNFVSSSLYTKTPPAGGKASTLVGGNGK